MTFTDEAIDDWAKYLRKGAPNRPRKEDVLFAYTADMLEQLRLDRAFLRTEIEAMRQAIRLRDEQISALQARIESADTSVT